MITLAHKSKAEAELAGSPQIDLNYLLFPDAPDQARFHADAYRVRNRLVSCGTGAGKTKAGAVEVISWALENPGSVGYVYMPTYRLIHRVLIPTLCDLLGVLHLETSPLVMNYSKGGGYIDWIAESRTYFGSLEEPEMSEGPNIDYAQIDEARLIRHLDLALKTVQRRLRGSGLTREGPGMKRQGLWVTTTPSFPGSVLDLAFENPKERLPGAKVYRWSTDKNITLPKEFIEGIKATHTGGLLERFFYGRSAAAEAITWPFDSTVHVIDALPKEFRAVQVAYGVDWGWTNPTAILAVLLDGDGRAYFVDEFYKSMAKDEEVVDAAKEMVQRWGQGIFWCDSAEPRSINKLKQAGLDAQPNASKREEGIRDVGSRFQMAGDGRPRTYILGACVNFISELQTYDSEKKERDHLCLIAGTRIATRQGEAPIEKIMPGDEVLTRQGYKRVLSAGMTQEDAEVMTVQFSNNQTLTGTPNHPVFIQGLDFVAMDSLRYTYIPESINNNLWHKELKQSSTKELSSGDTPIRNGGPMGLTTGPTPPISGGGLKPSIVRYGRLIMGRFLAVIQSITRTIIPQITISSIWSAYPTVNIPATITGHGDIPLNERPILSVSNYWPRNGTDRKKGGNGTDSMERRPTRSESPLSILAVTVEKTMRIGSEEQSPAFVQTTVNLPGGENKERTMKKESARYAGPLTKETNIKSGAPVHVVAVANYNQRQNVYNLDVKDAHEYYANGFLVHNCDGSRYVLMGLRQPGPQLLGGFGRIEL